MVRFCLDYGIVLSHSSNYEPQGTRMAKSSNKNLLRIIKKIVADNNRSWYSQLKFALWANRITKLQAIIKNPFELVYEMDVTLPIH